MSKRLNRAVKSKFNSKLPATQHGAQGSTLKQPVIQVNNNAGMHGKRSYVKKSVAENITANKRQKMTLNAINNIDEERSQEEEEEEPMEIDPPARHSSIQRTNIFDIGKALRPFRGGANDHFETWEGNTRLLLSEKGSNLTERQKVTEVILKIEGPPRMILMNYPNLTTLDQVFHALRPTYGADELTMLNETKQLPEERVKVYYSRLKTNLQLLGIQDTTEGSRVSLNHFTSGLLPHLKSLVTNLKPQRLIDAVAIAHEFEIDRITTDQSRKRKAGETMYSTLDEIGEGDLLTEMRRIQRSFFDKINNLQSKFCTQSPLPAPAGKSGGEESAHLEGILTNLATEVNKLNSFNLASEVNKLNSFQAYYTKQRVSDSNQRHSGSQSGTSQLNNAGSGEARYSRPPCFGCKELGHGYRSCQLISQCQKNTITDELKEFYRRARATDPSGSKPAISGFKTSVSLNSSGTRV